MPVVLISICCLKSHKLFVTQLLVLLHSAKQRSHNRIKVEGIHEQGQQDKVTMDCTAVMNSITPSNAFVDHTCITHVKSF